MRSFCLFEIDPIVDSICSELEPRHLHACALVSRPWHISFNRHLWRTIRIRQPCKLLIFKNPHMHSTLTKNCRAIQTIDTSFAELVLLLQQQLFLFTLATTTPATTTTAPLQNLTRLYCRSLSQAKFTHKVNNAFLNDILTFAQHTPRLQVLEFEHFKFTDEYVHQLVHLIKNHPHLRRVRIDCFQRVPLRLYLWLLWSAALHLESFEIVCWPYDNHHNYDANAEAVDHDLRTGIMPPDDDDDAAAAVYDPHRINKPFRIQELDLGQCHIAMTGGGGPTLATLLRHCSRLKSLTLPDISSPLELRELSVVIHEALGDLRHLDARALEGPDRILSELLDSCAGGGIGLRRNHGGQCSVRRGGRGRAGLESFFALGRDSVGWATVDSLRTCHSTTLTHLRLERCSAMTGAMLQTLLCSCSALERFESMMEHDPRLRDDDRSEPYLSEEDFGPTMEQLPKPKTDPFVTSNTRPPLTRMESNTGVDREQQSEKGKEEEEGVKGSAWACLALQALSIRMAGTQRAILPKVLGDQLCWLSELRHVRLGSTCRSNEEMIWDTGADASIRETFCRLAAMKRITFIELQGYKRQMSEANAALLEKEMQKLAIETILS